MPGDFTSDLDDNKLLRRIIEDVAYGTKSDRISAINRYERGLADKDKDRLAHRQADLILRRAADELGGLDTADDSNLAAALIEEARRDVQDRAKVIRTHARMFKEDNGGQN